MFYTYSQNNSGGTFDERPESGIAHIVIIEADSPHQADAKAEDIGIYFNGIDAGMDCDCCGDRWCNASTWDESTIPQIYGRPIVDGRVSPVEEPGFFDDYKWMKGPEGYIHYKDGRVEAFDY